VCVFLSTILGHLPARDSDSILECTISVLENNLAELPCLAESESFVHVLQLLIRMSASEESHHAKLFAQCTSWLARLADSGLQEKLISSLDEKGGLKM